MGISISELLQSDAVEIDEWSRYYSVVLPWQESIPQLLAESCAMFYNANTNPEKSKQLGVADFLPHLRPPNPALGTDNGEDKEVDICDILGTDGITD